MLARCGGRQPQVLPHGYPSRARPQCPMHRSFLIISPRQLNHKLQSCRLGPGVVNPRKTLSRNVLSKASGLLSDGSVVGAGKEVEERKFIAKSEVLTRCLAEAVADVAEVGDVVCLHGPVGAGKSVFSRHFIRRIMEDDNMVVPSPTYMLQNVYEHKDRPVHHFDLYRLQMSANQDRLGMDDSFTTAICLIEWPGRMRACLPAERLELAFEPVDSSPMHKDERNQNSEVHCALQNVQMKEGMEEVEEEESLYEDNRFRAITAVSHGQRWHLLMDDILSVLRAGDARSDFVD